jgi:hypothetical protein
MKRNFQRLYQIMQYGYMGENFVVFLSPLLNWRRNFGYDFYFKIYLQIISSRKGEILYPMASSCKPEKYGGSNDWYRTGNDVLKIGHLHLIVQLSQFLNWIMS